MPVTVGDKLGPYEILAPIGAGGMGEVWKARDTRLNRIVAIKRLKSAHTARFEQEARAVAALNHPHICQIHDVGPDYLVLEYIEGRPLRGPLAPEEALRLAIQIVRALEEAHAKGVLHRDLKPANILLNAQREAKLLDFGLAKLAGGDGDADATRTIEGTVLGTAAYMAPEQAQGQSLDARSDIFSFGAVLYEMFSGRRAFPGEHALSTIADVIHKEPEPLQAAPDVVRIVTRCLRKSPAERFQSAAELRGLLEHVSLAPSKQQPSVAVLPFANMSRDADDEYFSDGLAEEIINALTQVPGVKVIARTSAFAFKGKNEDVRKIAETLGVSNVLEGSVRRAGNRLRITAQLIHAVDGTHLWSQRYDRDMTDVFAIQDEISQAISEALQVKLAPRARTVNIEAYQHYLWGTHHQYRSTPESGAKAKEAFEQALAIEPNYALAHAGLALNHWMRVLGGGALAKDVRSLAMASADKAVALDPASAEAQSVRGMLAACVDFDWNTAEQYFRRALEMQPVPAGVRTRYAATYLIPHGRFAEAAEHVRLALESDPLRVVSHVSAMMAKFCLGRSEEATEHGRRALEIDPGHAVAFLWMGWIQMEAGSARDAVASATRVMELAPQSPRSGWFLAAAHYRAGDIEQARELAQKQASGGEQGIFAAMYYAVTGEADRMFETLDAVSVSQPAELIFLSYHPLFDPYRDDPRFQALLRKMNLA
jgi:eukaryotic-like serine/threonine-protein kinase